MTDSFKVIAGTLILLWGVAIFVFWIAASLPLGSDLAQIPSGLTAIVAALIAVTGWESLIRAKYQGQSLAEPPALPNAKATMP